jgi:hypothetical protein
VSEYYALLLAPYGWGDVATNTTAPYYARLYPKYVLEGSDVKPIILEEIQDQKPQYDEVLTKYKGKIILIDGVGHGRNDAIAGFMNVILERVPTPEGKYEGSFFKPISCLVGNGLLPDMASKNKDFAGLGEITEYWIMVEGAWMHKGEDWGEDPHLESFLRCEFDMAKALVQGMSAEEAYNLLLQRYEEEAKKWESQDPEQADLLRYDAQNRKLFGKPDWRRPGAPPPPPPPPPHRFVCPWCGFECEEAEVMQQHIKDAHQGAICPPCPSCDYTCAICGYKAKDAEDLTMHVFNVHKQVVVRYECPWCHEEFKSAEELAEHLCERHFKPCHLATWLRKRLGCGIEGSCV